MPPNNQQLLTNLTKRVDFLETEVAKFIKMGNTPADTSENTISNQSGGSRSIAKAQNHTAESTTQGQVLKPNAVIGHPSENGGSPVSSSPARHDPEAGFLNDEPIQIFRKAMITFQGQSYPEAILIFSRFLEKFPDHALAGSAQFYVGEAYMKQKEYKLALSEFQRVLTSYDRSAHVSDTLIEMALAEDTLKKSQQASVHRHLLSTLFPQSPASTPQTTGVTEKSPEPEENNAEAKAKSESPTDGSKDISVVPRVPPTAPLAEKPPEATPGITLETTPETAPDSSTNQVKEPPKDP